MSRKNPKASLVEHFNRKTEEYITQEINREGHLVDIVFAGFPSIKTPSIKGYRYRGTHGASTMLIDCGFCSTSHTVYLWSLAGGGKRCVKCRSYLHVCGYDYAITQQRI